MTIPETSSEQPLEHSEIANRWKIYFSNSHICTKNKNNPNQNQNKALDLKLDCHEPGKGSDHFCQEIKLATTQEPITVEIEWDNTNKSQLSGQKRKPKELAY